MKKEITKTNMSTEAEEALDAVKEFEEAVNRPEQEKGKASRPGKAAGRRQFTAA